VTSKTTILIKKRYDPSIDPGISCQDPSLAQQSAKDECDINNIIKKHRTTGLPLPTKTPVYGDFSNVEDYQSSLNAIHFAQQSFNGLPSELRKRFANDPGAFIEFAQDPRNGKELIDLGLASLSPLSPNLEASTASTSQNTTTTEPKGSKKQTEES